MKKKVKKKTRKKSLYNYYKPHTLHSSAQHNRILTDLGCRHSSHKTFTISPKKIVSFTHVVNIIPRPILERTHDYKENWNRRPAFLQATKKGCMIR